MADTFEAKQAEITVLFDRFATVLGMPGHAIAYAKAIERALWDAFPRCTKWHRPELFAEVLAFHALKAACLPIDQAAFRKGSPLGDMTMTKRHWLLHYSQYVPPSLRVASRDPGIDPFLTRVGDADLVAAARTIATQHEDILSRAKPSTRASVCLLLAIKSLPGYRGSASGLLARAGIRLASAINAAKRLELLSDKEAIQVNQGYLEMAMT